MLSYLKLKASTFFESGHERTTKIRKNILFSFILKGGSVLITLLLVPLTINYINRVQYGIWLTISSIVYWINVFDIGIGNGLKNEIAYSLAVKDERNLKTYVSTSYAVLAIISIFIFIAFVISSSFFDWNDILNISGKIDYDIRPVMLVVMGFFCIQFVVQVIDAVLSATQQVFKSSLILFLGQLIGLIVIYILTLFVPGSLLLLVIVMAGSSVLVLIVASIYLYSTELKKFAPRFRSIDFKHIRKLLNIGGAFFLIQIGAMLLIHANNFIITRVLGPEAVTTFNIPFRLFSFVSMLFAIIIMPYWSAFTDAYATQDLEWIKKNIKRLRIIWLSLSLLGLLVFIFSNFLYKIWIHNAVIVPISLSLCMLIYVMAYMWHTLHVYFLNGIGKIRLQLFVVVAGAIFNIPLAVYLGGRYGLQGVVGANSITFTIMGLIYTVQYRKIVSGTAVSIWNK
jgi:O-antigen/teichoic acid export membrane protein